MADDRPQTMALQGLANRVVLGLLATPGIAQGIGNRLITLYVVGRKSGKKYTVPVAYVPHDGVLLIGTPFGWARNLRTGEPVTVRYKGKLRQADVQVLTDEGAVVADYDVMVRQNKAFAGFNKVTFAPDGTPNPDDLHRAWKAGARVLRLTLR